MSYQNNDIEKPSFARRFFRALFRILLILLLLAAVVVGGYYGVVELRRSFDSVTTRIERNRRDINTVQEDLNALASGNPEQQQMMAELEEQVSDMDARLQTLSDDLATQQASLQTLSESMETQTGNVEANATELDALQDALVSLQGDVNENTTQIDSLGGEMDGIRGEVDALATEVENASENVSAVATRAGAAIVASDDATAELDEFSQTLLLFRAWSEISRARFRLLEGNAGLVAADVRTALGVLDNLSGAFSDEEAAALARAGERLEQALAVLPDNPTGAALDLDRAWDEIGSLLAERLPAAEPAATIEEAEETAAETEEAEETEETEEEATPTPTPAAGTASPTPPPPTGTPQATPTAYP
jgi:chromosome segregation ATPase